MAVFPTLSINPSYPLDETREDSVIRSIFEGGYEYTRPRFTRIRRTWTLKYELLSQADKDALDNFLVTVRGGADAFLWTHPVTNQTYNVRFVKPPTFSLSKYADGSHRYDVTIELREV